MDRKKLFGLGFCSVLLILIAGLVWAVPGSINYQGKLTDHDGTSVSDGTYSMHFRIYNVASGGTPLWEDVQSVDVTGGVYNVTIPADPVANPFTEVLINSTSLYLGIAVESDSEMTPRQEITSTFYALKAGDADSLAGQTISDLDDTYVNENQANSVTSSMIVDSTIGAADLGANSVGSSEIATGAVGSDEITDGSVSSSDLKDGAALAEILDDDGSGSGLDADLLDGHNSDYFVSAGNDYGRAGVAANLYEGSSTLTSRYVNEGQPGSITGAMIVDSTIKSADLADNSVNSSEIAAGAVGADKLHWSIDHVGSDLNGGLISLTNSSNGTTGNYPAGVFGGTSGTPGDSGVFGVLGASPTLGSNGALVNLPHTRIGVAGASTNGYGLAGVSSNGGGIYAYSAAPWGDGIYGVASNVGNYVNYGGHFKAAGVRGRGIGGFATGANGYGVYGSATGTSGYGVYADSTNGDGLYARTHASNEHAGFFYTGNGAGLAGAALYARAYNTTHDGIAFWAENAHTLSTDATAVLSNAGSGPLLKGFGGNGGEDEFRFENDGTLNFFNSSHELTVRVDPEEGTGGVGGQITLYNGDGAATIQIDGDYFGDGRVTTQELQITGGSDLSEQFDVSERLNPLPGMLVSIDPERPGKLCVSTVAYDKKVAGIISGAGGIKTGVMMGQRGTMANGALPIALTGRVYCMADTSNGAIEPGDMLTTSAIPGHAMKVTDHAKAAGAIIGKAMTCLNNGEGLVLVLVTLQ